MRKAGLIVLAACLLLAGCGTKGGEENNPRMARMEEYSFFDVSEYYEAVDENEDDYYQGDKPDSVKKLKSRYSFSYSGSSKMTYSEYDENGLLIRRSYGKANAYNESQADKIVYSTPDDMTIHCTIEMYGGGIQKEIYDRHYQLRQVEIYSTGKDENGIEQEVLVSRMSYNKDGLPYEKYNASLGIGCIYKYDEEGNVIGIESSEQGVTYEVVLENNTRTATQYISGEPALVESEEFNDKKQLIKSTAFDSSTQTYISWYELEYDDAGNVIYQLSKVGSGLESTFGEHEAFAYKSEYDKNGNEICRTIMAIDGEDITVYYEQTMEYDLADRLISQTTLSNAYSNRTITYNNTVEYENDEDWDAVSKCEYSNGTRVLLEQYTYYEK